MWAFAGAALVAFTILLVVGALRDVVLRLARAAERRADAQRDAALVRLDAQRLDDMEERFAAVETESRDVATRVRQAGLGERLGRR